MNQSEAADLIEYHPPDKGYVRPHDLIIEHNMHVIMSVAANRCS